MQRILSKKDDNAVHRELTEASRLSSVLEKMLNELQQFEVDLPSQGDLPEFTKDPEAYVKKKIADELAAENQMKLGKRKQNVNKVIATLDLGDFTRLNELAAQARSLPARPYNKMVIAEADGVVTVSTHENYKAELEEKHSRYAETDEEIELYNDIKAVADAVGNFEAKHMGYNTPESRFTFREKTPLLYFTRIVERYVATAQKKGIL